jgi:DNA-binding LytR/AlgR family response regulator
MKIHTLIVDDEPLNRTELHSLLKPYDKIGVIFEAESSKEAMHITHSQEIDLVFLDIEMEEKKSGLGLAKQMSRLPSPPLIIFVTAHEEHSLKSYDYAPLHYLLKPINEKILDNALERAFRLKITPRLMLKHRKIDRFNEVSYPVACIQTEDILYIQKNKLGNTVSVFLSDREILEGIRQTLNRFLDDLDSTQFARVHTSFIVNLSKVQEIRQRASHAENYCLVVTNNKALIPISRSHLEEVKILLSKGIR